MFVWGVFQAHCVALKLGLPKLPLKVTAVASDEFKVPKSVVILVNKSLGKAEVSLWVFIPETANHLIAQMIFMFEYNVRSGTVIGIVGAGGIGYYINLYLKFLQYERVAAYLLIIFFVVMLIDLVSIYLRSFFTDESENAKPTWAGVFLPQNNEKATPSEWV